MRTVLLHDEILIEPEFQYDDSHDRYIRMLKSDFYKKDPEQAFAFIEPYPFSVRPILRWPSEIVMRALPFIQRVDVDAGPDVLLSPRLMEIADREPIPYDTIMQFKRAVALSGVRGTILFSHERFAEAFSVAEQYPAKIFSELDSAWQKFAQDIEYHRADVIIAPILQVVLSKCERRDAIPSVSQDLRLEWESPRQKLWQLLGELRDCATAPP